MGNPEVAGARRIIKALADSEFRFDCLVRRCDDHEAGLVLLVEALDVPMGDAFEVGVELNDILNAASTVDLPVSGGAYSSKASARLRADEAAVVGRYRRSIADCSKARVVMSLHVPAQESASAGLGWFATRESIAFSGCTFAVPTDGQARLVVPASTIRTTAAIVFDAPEFRTMGGVVDYWAPNLGRRSVSPHKHASPSKWNDIIQVDAGGASGRLLPPVAA